MWLSIKSIRLSCLKKKKARSTVLHTVWFNLYGIREKAKLTCNEVKTDTWFPWAGHWGTDKDVPGNFFRVIKMFFILIVLVVTFVRTHQAVNFKWEHFVTRKLYLDKAFLKKISII